MNKCGVLIFGMTLLGWPLLSAAPVKSTQTVEVRVEVTEVDGSKASSLGVRWLDRFQTGEVSVPGLVQVGKFTRLEQLRADLNLLMEEGAAELLANPNLLTNSGTSASFHAGGEIPYVTSTNLGGTHVEFKPYGVMLTIEPDVLESGLIELKIKASVSAPDQTNGVILAGQSVPALLEREVSSHVTLAPDTTMTLAGLLQTQKDEKVQGVPILRRIPLLGALFRWRRTSTRRTTIVMFVTPRLVTS